MANYETVIPFMKAWEGGLSRATTDTASANPAPWTYKGVTGWHTNKGITFPVFQKYAPMFGYAVSPENFFNMPDDLWKKIFKVIYWDGMQLDKVRSAAIAAALSNWSWGSGDYGAFQLLKGYLKSKGKIVNSDAEAAEAINDLSLLHEEQIFKELITIREEFFKSLGQPANLQGWLNRLIYGDKTRPSMLQFGMALIKKKDSSSEASR